MPRPGSPGTAAQGEPQLGPRHRRPWRRRSWACAPAWFRCGGRPSAPVPWRGRRSPWRPQTTPMSRAPRASAWPRPATMPGTRSKRLPPTGKRCRCAGRPATRIATMLSVANLSLLLFERGELQEAASLCRRVIAEAEKVGALHSPAVASVRGALAHVLYEWNELEEARLEAQAALELGQRSGHVASVAYGSIVLSRIEAARGEPAAAEQLVEQARQLRGRSMPAWVTPYIVRPAGGAGPGARRRAGGADGTGRQRRRRRRTHRPHARGDPPGLPAPAALPPGRQTVRQMARQRVRPAGRPLAGELSETIVLWPGASLASAEAGGRLGRTIEALCVRAIALQAQGKTGAGAGRSPARPPAGGPQRLHPPLYRAGPGHGAAAGGV